jgi:large-conductance mechanosensitive channel
MSITNTYIIPVFATDNDLHILKFVKEMVTFLFITFTTFFFIQYFFKRIAESESKVPEPKPTTVVDVSKNTSTNVDSTMNRYSFLSSPPSHAT